MHCFILVFSSSPSGRKICFELVDVRACVLRICTKSVAIFVSRHFVVKKFQLWIFRGHPISSNFDEATLKANHLLCPS